MIGDYTFTLNGNSCEPIYSNDLKKIYTLDKEGAFYKVDLSGDITFVQADYAYIMSQPFDTKFLFNIYYKGSLYFSGSFTRIDCLENSDSNSIKTTINSDEAIDNVLTGIEKEVDVVALKPELENITMYRRPITQHYLLGDNSIYCSLGGSTWVQPLSQDPPNNNALLNTYFFTWHGDIGELYLTPVSSVAYPAFTGSWYLNTSNYFFYRSGVANMRLEYILTAGQNTWTFYIVNTSTLQAVYASSDFVGNFYEFTFTFTNVSNPSDRFTVTGYWSALYSRTLTAKPIYSSIEADLLPEGDITVNNRNYKYAFPGQLGNHVAQYETSELATEFGRTRDGKYFLPPNTSVGNYFPIKRDRWMGTSMWINLPLSTTLRIQDDNWRVPFIFKDAYILESVIDLLLKQINPAFSFKRSQSQFLYNWQSLGFSFEQVELYITQKTNILRDGYDQAAQRGIISLKQILDALWLLYQCKWHMVGNALHIEHISYYKQGRTYFPVGATSLDLRGETHARHYKPYTFQANKYSYDKEALPEELQYSYNEPVSDAFQSGSIKVVSNFIEKGKVEKNSLAIFNPDIDSLLLNPENTGKEGFVLLAANSINKRLPFRLLLYADSTDYYIQNGGLSYRALLPVFFMYDLPAKTVEINGVTYAEPSIKGIRKTKKQSIWFSYEDDPDPTSLIKTQVGDGRIEKMEINLTSRRVDLSLRYDTY